MEQIADLGLVQVVGRFLPSHLLGVGHVVDEVVGVVVDEAGVVVAGGEDLRDQRHVLRLHPEAQVEQGLFQQLAAFHIFQRLDAGGGQADKGLVVIQRLLTVKRRTL